MAETLSPESRARFVQYARIIRDAWTPRADCIFHLASINIISPEPGSMEMKVWIRINEISIDPVSFPVLNVRMETFLNVMGLTDFSEYWLYPLIGFGVSFFSSLAGVSGAFLLVFCLAIPVLFFLKYS